MPYVNVVHYFHYSQQNFPFQNKHSGDDFVLGLAVGVCIVSEGTVHKTLVNF